MRRFPPVLLGMGLALAIAGCGGSAAPAASSSAPAASPQASAGSTSGAPASASTAAGTSGGQRSPQLTKLIQEANKEGHLTLTWGQDVLGGSKGAKEIEAGLNQLYGTHIQISFTPGPSEPQVAAQITAEYKAHQKAVSDIYISPASNQEPLVEQKVLQTVDWPALLPGRVTSTIAEQNLAVRLFTGISGIEYNTNEVKGAMIPKTMQDLLKPEWKGKIYTTPYAAGFDYLASKQMWGLTKTLDYVKKLAPQVGGLMRCGESQRVASGEVPGFGLDCDGTAPLRLAAQGAPIAQVIPLDAAAKRYFYLSVPKNAAHLKVAELTTAFMLTPQGQALSWKLQRADLDSFPGSHTRQRVQALQKQGAKFFAPSIQYLISHPELNKAIGQMRKILARK